MQSANRYQPSPYVKIAHPEWSWNAVIYQINTRQFTEEGTFRAAEKQLPQLKELGIDIVWLMLIHDIGVKNRKGTLGSPYSVKVKASVTETIRSTLVSSRSRYSKPRKCSWNPGDIGWLSNRQ